MRHANIEGLPSSVLGRVMTLLTSFTVPDSELTLTELAQRSRIPKPTAHRLVAEMVEWQVLERTADGGIRLGILLFELGQLAPRQRSLRETAQPFLSDLHRATGLTAHLGLLDGESVVYLDKISASSGPALPSRIGGRMPLYCTAIGKALLAFAGEELIGRVVRGELRRRTPHTIAMPRLLLRQLDQVRETGVAFEKEESTLGVVCVASPAFGRDGRPAGALSISGWSSRVDIAKAAPAVRTAALALSRELGATDRSTCRDPS